MTEPTNRLSDSDALLWRIEGDPVLRSPILVVGLLDREPAPARLDAALRRAVAAIPQLRQRLVPGPLGTRPHWEEDESFSLEHHVRRVRATSSAGVHPVLQIAEPDVMTAFDPARPLWQLTIVDGLDAGGSAMVLRFHHAITDGVGGIALARHLFEPTRRASKPAEVVPTAPPPPPSSNGTSGLPARAAGLATSLGRAGLDPLGSARAGVRTARSIARLLAPAREPRSPIMRGRGLDRRLHVLEMPLRDLRAVARVTGATVNHVLLAAIAGGVHEYHDQLGAPVAALRITMPISLRTDGDAPGGNHFTPARFVLPIDEPDPRQRIELAGAIVRAWRAEPAIGLTPVLAWALDQLPRPLVQRTFGGMLRSVDVDAVDVPGLREPAYLAGARVDRLWAFAPTAGSALSVTLVSHLDVACVGISSDVAAVADPELLSRCIDQGFDQVLSLAGHGSLSEVRA